MIKSSSFKPTMLEKQVKILITFYVIGGKYNDVLESILDNEARLRRLRMLNKPKQRPIQRKNDTKSTMMNDLTINKHQKAYQYF